MDNKDIYQKFLFDDFPIRGSISRLNDSLFEIISLQKKDEFTSEVMAHTLSFCVSLGCALKLGKLSLQFPGDNLLLADYFSEGYIRAFSKNNLDKSADDYFAFCENSANLVIENNSNIYTSKIYTGKSFEDLVHNYMGSSEQILTSYKSAYDPKTMQSVAIIIQFMPTSDDKREYFLSKFEEIQLIFKTLSHDELLEDIDNEKLLYRLFNQYNLKIFEPKKIKAGCQCSAEKIVNVLKNYEKEMLEELLEDGKINSQCDFCKRKYSFGLDEITK